MTALNISTDIPSQINTLERLVVWAAVTLKACNPTLRVVETANAQGEYVAISSIFQADGDESTRFFGRCSIKLDPNWSSNTTQKLWQNAQELSNTAIPDAFKAN
jgi:hypothetical protein